MLRCERDRHDGETDEQRVPEVQRRHGGVLIAELVLRPNTAFALGAMHCIDEAETTRFFAHSAGDVWVGQESRRHAWPQCENDEGNEVAGGHCAAARFVQLRPGGATVWLTVGRG